MKIGIKDINNIELNNEDKIAIYNYDETIKLYEGKIIYKAYDSNEESLGCGFGIEHMNNNGDILFDYFAKFNSNKYKIKLL